MITISYPHPNPRHPVTKTSLWRNKG